VTGGTVSAEDFGTTTGLSGKGRTPKAKLNRAIANKTTDKNFFN
jgi:hypothetical protein